MAVRAAHRNFGPVVIDYIVSNISSLCSVSLLMDFKKKDFKFGWAPNICQAPYFTPILHSALFSVESVGLRSSAHSINILKVLFINKKIIKYMLHTIKLTSRLFVFLSCKLSMKH